MKQNYNSMQPTKEILFPQNYHTKLIPGIKKYVMSSLLSEIHTAIISLRLT